MGRGLSSSLEAVGVRLRFTATVAVTDADLGHGHGLGNGRRRGLSSSLGEGNTRDDERGEAKQHSLGACRE